MFFRAHGWIFKHKKHPYSRQQQHNNPEGKVLSTNVREKEITANKKG